MGMGVIVLLWPLHLRWLLKVTSAEWRIVSMTYLSIRQIARELEFYGTPRVRTENWVTSFRSVQLHKWEVADYRLRVNPWTQSQGRTDEDWIIFPQFLLIVSLCKNVKVRQVVQWKTFDFSFVLRWGSVSCQGTHAFVLKELWTSCKSTNFLHRSSGFSMSRIQSMAVIFRVLLVYQHHRQG